MLTSDLDPEEQEQPGTEKRKSIRKNIRIKHTKHLRFVLNECIIQIYKEEARLHKRRKAKKMTKAERLLYIEEIAKHYTRTSMLVDLLCEEMEGWPTESKETALHEVTVNMMDHERELREEFKKLLNDNADAMAPIDKALWERNHDWINGTIAALKMALKE